MKNISIAKLHYIKFRDSLNKIEAFDNIMNTVCERAIKSAAQNQELNFLQKLKNDITISEEIAQSANSYIETLNRLKESQQEEIVNKPEISEEFLQVQILENQPSKITKSVDTHSNKSTGNNNLDHYPNLTIKQYIASMLLQFAVQENDLEITKLLLKSYQADPRIEDSITHQSAMINALDAGNLKCLKIFANDKNLKENPQSLVEDYLTISSIYTAITSEHEYDSQELLGSLNNLYTDIDSIFS